MPRMGLNKDMALVCDTSAGSNSNSSYIKDIYGERITTGCSNPTVGKNLCWIRDLRVEFISQKYGDKLVFGDQESSNYTIKIEGTKYVSGVKDKGTITISNLSYATMLRLMEGEYYQVNIMAGYKSQGSCFYVFKGYVAYISQKINPHRDWECYIIFASKMVAQYSIRRINWTMNSGVNMYAMMRYITLQCGIPNSTINDSLKNYYFSQVSAYYTTPADLVDQIAGNQGPFLVDNDDTDGSGVVNVSTINDKRWIRINKDTVNFASGLPKITSDGVNIKLLPTLNFKPGDILIINNALLDGSIPDAEGVSSTFTTNYFDTTFKNSDHPQDGTYMIIEVKYTLENRGSNYVYDIQARGLSIITNITGYGG